MDSRKIIFSLKNTVDTGCATCSSLRGFLERSQPGIASSSSFFSIMHPGGRLWLRLISGGSSIPGARLLGLRAPTHLLSDSFFKTCDIPNGKYEKSLDPSWLYNQLPAHAARTLVGKFHATAETPWPFQDIDARLQCQMCSLSSAWMCVCVCV
jgi:hypothetical protein